MPPAVAEETAKEEPSKDEPVPAGAPAQVRVYLRWFFWIGFVLGPIAAAFGLLDVGAHMEHGPRIGLEGNGAPNALPYLFAMIAFASGTGALVARAFSPEPRPPIIAGVILGILCFIGAFLVARPVFRWKWELDCSRDVARACWAISELEADAAKKDELRAKACRLGDTRGCPAPPPDASAQPDASTAPSGEPAPSAAP